jgi:hypothetical protein
MTDRLDNDLSLDTAASTERYHGEVVYLYAFDLAYDMNRQPLTEILGRPVQEYSIGPSKRSPKQLFFYKPQMVILPEEERRLAEGSVRIRRIVKVYNIGAVSIQIRVPFQDKGLEDLVGYHNLAIQGSSVEHEARQLAGKVLEELRPYCIRPVSQPDPYEEYTVFCLRDLPGRPRTGGQTEAWLKDHRRGVAGLLTEEEDASLLSRQETVDSTRPYLSYYDNDLVVADWDSALVIGDDEAVEDVLHIMEVANVQLLELEAYDRLLDSALERAYRDLNRARTGIGRDVYRDLREIRVDMARLTDELENITKFFGDWHLARIYQQVCSRFHLADWNRIINEKLQTLADLYQLLQQDRNNFWMMILETTIVLLFILDLLLLLWNR